MTLFRFDRAEVVCSQCFLTNISTNARQLNSEKTDKHILKADLSSIFFYQQVFLLVQTSMLTFVRVYVCA